MHDQEFNKLVNNIADGLDREHATGDGPLMARPLAGAERGTPGNLFRQAMSGIKDRFGAIPWSKVIAVIAVVVQDIKNGKDVGEIITDVVNALLSGQL